MKKTIKILNNCGKYVYNLLINNGSGLRRADIVYLKLVLFRALEKLDY